MKEHKSIDEYRQSYLDDVEESYAVSYAMVMWKLQEMCGLSYKEARAYLQRHWETEEDLAEDLGITVASVRKLGSRAAWKVRNSGFEIGEICGKYDMILFRSVNPRSILLSSPEGSRVTAKMPAVTPANGQHH